MLKRPSAMLLPICVLTVAIAGGAALIRSGVKHRMAEQRTAAVALAARAAYRIEQRLAEEAAVVQALAIEMSRGRALAVDRTVEAAARPEEAHRTIFLIPDESRTADGRRPVRHGVQDAAAIEWMSDLTSVSNVAGPRTALVGPRRSASGEWLALVRAPLRVVTAAGQQAFSGWIAASFPLDALIEAADLDHVTAAGFDFELRCLLAGNPRAQVIAGSANGELTAPVVQVVHTTDDRWAVAVAPHGGWIPWDTIVPQSVLVLVFALVVAILTADLAHRPDGLRLELAARDNRLRAVHERLAEEIQQRESLESQFTHANLHDALTGLANRRFFLERLDRALKRARQRPGQSLAVILVNFDRFKNISDSLGPGAADEVLLEAVRRFRDALAGHEHVAARFADDELAVMLVDVASPEVAQSAAERMHAALGTPFTVDGQTVFASARIGIAVSATGYDGADELVRGAHIALSNADVEGGTRTAIFDPATREQIVTRQQLETDLHQAIDRGEFYLTFQPIVSLSTGRLCGMETLIRWRHPLEGVISPASFIPVAEETGLIVPITRWVLREACGQARAWLDEFGGTVDFYLSVNLSAQDLRQPDLCDFVASTIQAAGLPPGVLRLELTESMMIGNINDVSALVSRLRAMQVPILLDDFGTGYSSLGYLNRFKFDCLKIDQSFVSRMGHGDQSAGIVRAIVHLAHDLGIQTIAEGIDSPEHCRQLIDLGCDYGQGYYYSKPVQIDGARKLLESQAGV